MRFAGQLKTGDRIAQGTIIERALICPPGTRSLKVRLVLDNGTVLTLDSTTTVTTL